VVVGGEHIPFSVGYIGKHKPKHIPVLEVGVPQQTEFGDLKETFRMIAMTSKYRTERRWVLEMTLSW
jgi:hypothetical protein